MKKYLVAGALVVAFATPAFAADYYVALRLGGGAAACEAMTTPPDAKTHRIEGPVQASEAEAKVARATSRTAARKSTRCSGQSLVKTAVAARWATTGVSPFTGYESARTASMAIKRWREAATYGGNL